MFIYSYPVKSSIQIGKPDLGGGLNKGEVGIIGTCSLFSFFFHDLVLPLPLRGIKKQFTYTPISCIHMHTYTLHVYMQKHLAFQKYFSMIWKIRKTSLILTKVK